MKEAICTVIMKWYFTREGSILLVASKNELFAAKVNGFQCKLLPQIAPSEMLQAL